MASPTLFLAVTFISTGLLVANFFIQPASATLDLTNLYNTSGHEKSRASSSNDNFNLVDLNAGYSLNAYSISRITLFNIAPDLINTGTHIEQTYGSVGSEAKSGSGPICGGARPTYT